MLATLSYKDIASPIGKLSIIASAKGLCGLYFSSNDSRKYFSQMERDGTLVKDEAHKLLASVQSQLDEYFAGKRKEFKLPLDMQGTVFQINAWRQLQKIPYGKTISYGEQAARLGDPKKARAIGGANNRNPLAIIVPCHRVVGSDGKLVGFGGGLGTKQFLLDLERKHCS